MLQNISTENLYPIIATAVAMFAILAVMFVIGGFFFMKKLARVLKNDIVGTVESNSVINDLIRKAVQREAAPLRGEIAELQNRSRLLELHYQKSEAEKETIHARLDLVEVRATVHIELARAALVAVLNLHKANIQQEFAEMVHNNQFSDPELPILIIRAKGDPNGVIREQLEKAAAADQAVSTAQLAVEYAAKAEATTNAQIEEIMISHENSDWKARIAGSLASNGAATERVRAEVAATSKR